MRALATPVTVVPLERDVLIDVMSWFVPGDVARQLASRGVFEASLSVGTAGGEGFSPITWASQLFVMQPEASELYRGTDYA